MMLLTYALPALLNLDNIFMLTGLKVAALTWLRMLHKHYTTYTILHIYNAIPVQYNLHLHIKSCCSFYVKSNLSLYSLDYVEACNELARPISLSRLVTGNTAAFEEMLQRWRAVFQFKQFIRFGIS